MARTGRKRDAFRRAAVAVKDLRHRHAERRRPSGFHFAVADRVDFLDGEAWDAITRSGSIFLQRRMLRVIEQAGPSTLEPRYALVYRDGRPAAAIAAQMLSVTGDRLRAESGAVQREKPARPWRRALAPATDAAVARIDQRVLVAGNVMSWGFHGVAFAEGEEASSLWPGVAEALYRIRRADRLTGQTNFVLVKDITAAENGLDVLRTYSYRPLETEPNMVLAIDPAWGSHEGYLGALDSKYRRNARDQVKKLTNAGCTIERLVDPGPHAGRLHELYMAVHKNAAVRLVTLPESFLPSLATALGDDFRCTVIRRENDVLGFVTSVRDGDTAVAYYIGFDRAAAADGLPLYLRLLHATVGDAIEWGCRRLSLGRTALEPKAALGAKPEPMTVWVRHRVPALNWILRGALTAVTHDEAPERNPFKRSV